MGARRMPWSTAFYGLSLAQTLLAGLLRGKAYLGIYESLLMQFAEQIIGAYIQRLAGVEQRACQVETRQVVVQVLAILGKRHEFAEAPHRYRVCLLPASRPVDAPYGAA